VRRNGWLIMACVALVAVLAGCAPPATIHPAAAGSTTAPSGTHSPMPARAMPTTTTTPKAKPTLQPGKSGVDTGGAKASKPGADGVPVSGAGTFTVSPGGTAVVGGGATLVTYETQLENGIAWGSNPQWTAASFAATVDAVMADPRGWIASKAAPITDAAQGLNNASWRFQRVSSGSYNVKILLATPNTTDRLCGSVGLNTLNQYSCRYGNTMVINLRRWLKGAPGFAMSLDGYHTMVIDHEMGHRLGFDHMLCPGSGKPAPVMQEETVDLAGCVPNPYPYAANGTFISGPWAAS
jgi:hypothetical protein